jgi:hypothetical protein
MTDPTPPGAVASALHALRYNPLIIGVLLLNVLFVVASAWYITHTADGRHEAIKVILERCLPANK